MGEGLLMHSLGLSQQTYWLGVREGADRGFECLQIPLMECHWQSTRWLLDHIALWGQPGLPHGHAHGRAPGDPVLSQELYWAVVGQASGLGDLSCLDHTKLGANLGMSVHTKCASHWG